MEIITPKIIQKAQEFIQEKKAPSISIFIQKNEEIIINEAFGYSDIHKKIKATSGSLYNIGSMLKLMTASCVAILKDRGLLSFQSKDSNFLSLDFCKKNKNRKCNHSSIIDTYKWF